MNEVIGRIALLDEKNAQTTDSLRTCQARVAKCNNWSSGIAFELDHHRKWVCGVDCYGPVIGEGWFKYERETKLKGEPIEPHRSRICHLLKNYYADPHHVRVMVDHGAGPFTNLGKWFTCPEDVWSGVGAQVIAVDPLASGYNSILNEFHIHNTLRTSYCKSEILSTCIGKSVADFAVIVNALDHSENPMLGFIESLRVVKVGGLSCVFSIRNEAAHMGGKGFHHWNLDLGSNGDWIITNWDTKLQHNMTQILSEFAQDVPTFGAAEDGQLWKCFKKTHDVPDLFSQI